MKVDGAPSSLNRNKSDHYTPRTMKKAFEFATLITPAHYQVVDNCFPGEIWSKEGYIELKEAQ